MLNITKTKNLRLPKIYKYIPKANINLCLIFLPYLILRVCLIFLRLILSVSNILIFLPYLILRVCLIFLRLILSVSNIFKSHGTFGCDLLKYYLKTLKNLI